MSCSDLERTAHFYETFFAGTAGAGYVSPSSPLQTRFVVFENGGFLQLVLNAPSEPGRVIAPIGGPIRFEAGTAAEQEYLARRLSVSGFVVTRRETDTARDSPSLAVLDPDGSLVLITRRR